MGGRLLPEMAAAHIAAWPKFVPLAMESRSHSDCGTRAYTTETVGGLGVVKQRVPCCPAPLWGDSVYHGRKLNLRSRVGVPQNANRQTSEQHAPRLQLRKSMPHMMMTTRMTMMMRAWCGTHGLLVNVADEPTVRADHFLRSVGKRGTSAYGPLYY